MFKNLPSIPGWIVRYGGILGILALALVLRLGWIDRGLAFDEIFAANNYIKDKSFLDILANFWITNHIGYTIIAYPCYHLLGAGEWALRLPALSFGLASIVLLWHWVKDIFGSKAALLSSFLMAVSPVMIIFSVSARGYTALVFFGLLLTILYFRLLRSPAWGLAAIYAAVFIVGISFHVFLLAVLLCQLLHVITFLFRSSLRNAFIKVCGAFGLALAGSALVYIPLTMASWVRIAKDYHNDLNPYFPFYLTWDLLSLPFMPFGWVLLAAVLAGLICSKTDLLPRWRLYGFILILLPFAAWLLKPPFLFFRFFAYLVPLFFVYLSVLLIRVEDRAVGIWRVAAKILIAFILCLITAGWFLQKDKTYNENTGTYRDAAVYAQQVSSAQTRYCAMGDYAANLYRYYADRPISLFGTFADFQSFYQQGGDVVCFLEPGRLTTDDEKKVLYLMMKYASSAKRFGDILVFTLK